MKKIEITPHKIFEIAKIVKTYLPEIKVQIHLHETRIVLYLPKKVDYFKLEELKTLFKLKYPHHQLVFYFNN